MAKKKIWGQMNWKERGKKTWHFLWHEDSLASWLVNIVLAFVLIKFLLYPGLGLVLDTEFPVVAVVSSSMEHHPGDFDEWWSANEDFYLSKNITKFDFQTYPFKGGFNKGDIMVLTGLNPDNAKEGQVIVYWSRKPYPIIHRYIGQNPLDPVYLTSKGDNNPAMVQTFDLNEYMIHPDMVVGKAVLRIPFLGYVKIWAVDLLNLLLPN
ncbi:signal peptidase I [Candidatus Woesearchaeota archaeon]|nr:signal peptidase I [Candidatus Woesearchaeota archaeon]